MNKSIFEKIDSYLKLAEEKTNSSFKDIGLGRINSFAKNIGGYKIIIFANMAILVLVLALVFIQHSWIKKEREAIKSIINESKMNKSVGANNYSPLQIKDEEPENLFVNTGDNDRRVNGSSIARSKNKSTLDVEKMIKEADMYYDYEQYEKAVIIYEELAGADFAFENSDKIFNRLAECYYKAGDYEKALKIYKRVCNDYLHSPYRLNSQLGLGRCLIKTNNFGEGRRILYALAGKEAKYKKEEDKLKVIEAYYEIADSYIKQAKTSYVKR